MKYRKGCVLIDIKNAYNPETIKMKNKKYVSSKNERNREETGIGIGNIKSTVEKYDGISQSSCNEVCFDLQILIPDKKIG